MTDRSGPDDAGPITPQRALAVYGTLAPGESNHDVVAGIGGAWVPIAIRGHRFTARWRDTPGYPGFTPDPAGPIVEALALVADDLTGHWDRLDGFEGPGYRRVEIDVFEPGGNRAVGRACVYQTLPDFWD
ncbi:MAG: gamma-glutamylcyclotransferase [Actinomycetota bacterium]